MSWSSRASKWLFFVACLYSIHRIPCHKIYLKPEMSDSLTDSNNKSRFKFLLCLDLVVVVCILVIAGRPEGLAITVSAIIVCVAALIYRGTVGVKTYVANSAAKAKAARRHAGQRSRQAPSAATVTVKPSSRAWLRDSE